MNKAFNTIVITSGRTLREDEIPALKKLICDNACHGCTIVAADKKNSWYLSRLCNRMGYHFELIEPDWSRGRMAGPESVRTMHQVYDNNRSLYLCLIDYDERGERRMTGANRAVGQHLELCAYTHVHCRVMELLPSSK